MKILMLKIYFFKKRNSDQFSSLIAHLQFDLFSIKIFIVIYKIDSYLLFLKFFCINNFLVHKRKKFVFLIEVLSIYSI